MGTYNGTPAINIPIYTVDATSIKLPISLSYHASGIKIKEEASSVGLGWTLNAGGSIMRTIMGKDDFGSLNPYFRLYDTLSLFGGLGNRVGDYGRWIIGPDQEDPSHSTGCKVGSVEIPLLAKENLNRVDFQPDVYYYNFHEKTGKFLLYQSGKPMFYEKQRIKLSHDGQLSFNLITDDGTQYTFASREHTYSSSEGGTGTTAWYLTSITSIENDVIQFYYNPVYDTIKLFNESMSGHLYAEEALFINQERGYEQVNPCRVCPDESISSNGYSETITRSVVLDSIVSNSSVVVFHHSKSREDLKSSSKVDSISVYSKERKLIKRTILVFSYFQSDVAVAGSYNQPSSYFQSTSDPAKRLRLDRIIEKAGNISKGDYVFEYNQIKLPYKTSFSFDHWGFYNGHANVGLQPKFRYQYLMRFSPPITGIMPGANREPNIDLVQAGMLRKIYYPTGGVTSFEFESHEYNNSKYLFWDEITKQNPSRHNLSRIWNGSVESSYSSPIPSKTFTIKSAVGYGYVYAKPYIAAAPNGVNPQDLKLTIRNLASGEIVYWNNLISNAANNERYFTLPDGNYIIESFCCQQAYGKIDVEVYTLDHAYKRQVGGGVRIKRMIDESTSSAPKVTRYVYNKEIKTSNGATTGDSYGKLLSPISYHYASFTFIAPDLASHDYVSCSSMRWQSGSTIPLTTAHGSPVGYDSVKVYSGEYGENGSQLFIYNNIPYVEIYEPLGPARPSFIPTVDSPANGLLKQKEDYTSEGVLLKRQINRYFVTESNLKPACVLEVNPNESAMGCNGIELHAYNLGAIWTALESTISEDYSKIGQPPVRSVVQYEYDIHNKKHYYTSRVTQQVNNNRKVITEMLYPEDYTSGEGFIGKLKNDFILSTPIETMTYDIHPSENVKKILQGEIITFKNNGFKGQKDQVWRLELDKSTSDFSPSNLNGSFTMDRRYISKLRYDNYGNFRPTQFTKEGNETVSLIWGGGNSYIIAEAKVAAEKDIAFTSFESGSDGHWLIASNARVNTDKVTGNNSYSLSAGSITKQGLTSSQIYVISFWARNGSNPSLSVGTPSAGISKNGWTYYEKIFSGVTSILISGNGIVDDLRLFPQGALMSTYTHSPGLGMTSSTDSNNITNYFEYDAMGRLKFVKDDKKQIIKTIQYNYLAR